MKIGKKVLFFIVILFLLITISMDKISKEPDIVLNNDETNINSVSNEIKDEIVEENKQIILEDNINTLIAEVKDSKILENEQIINAELIADDTYILTYKNNTDALDNYNDLFNNENVINIIPDLKVEVLNNLDIYANDTMPWGINTTGLNNYLNYLKYQDKKTVKVAVLDTGIKFSHEVFENRINTSYSYDYVNYDNDVTDDSGHGTSVAGLIALSTPSNVQIYPIKVIDESGSGRLSDMYKALLNIKGKVDIINLSLGIKTSELGTSYYNISEKVFKQLYDSGTIVVCAAGNSGKEGISYPASSKYTIAVSSINKNNLISSFSSYGNEIDFSAPGEKLVTPNFSGNSAYSKVSGTSFSAPFITSAIALIKSQYNYSYQEIMDVLKNNIQDLGEIGKDKYYGYGNLNFNLNLFKSPIITKISTENKDDKVLVNFSTVSGSDIIKYAIITDDNIPTTWNSIKDLNKIDENSYSYEITDNNSYYIWLQNENGEIGKEKIIVDTILNDSYDIKYQTHVQNIGWQNSTYDENVAGTTGKALRLEAININLADTHLGSIVYQTHIQNIGWQDYVSDGMISGTTGKSLRLEAIKIKLTGEVAKYYDVYYRVHVENIGWMNWVKNDEIAGTTGRSLRLEAIQIKLVAK